MLEPVKDDTFQRGTAQHTITPIRPRTPRATHTIWTPTDPILEENNTDFWGFKRLRFLNPTWSRWIYIDLHFLSPVFPHELNSSCFVGSALFEASEASESLPLIPDVTVLVFCDHIAEHTVNPNSRRCLTGPHRIMWLRATLKNRLVSRQASCFSTQIHSDHSLTSPRFSLLHVFVLKADSSSNSLELKFDKKKTRTQKSTRQEKRWMRILCKSWINIFVHKSENLELIISAKVHILVVLRQKDGYLIWSVLEIRNTHNNGKIMISRFEIKALNTIER